MTCPCSDARCLMEHLAPPGWCAECWASAVLRHRVRSVRLRNRAA